MSSVIRAETSAKLPYQAGWQDLKDLFRSAGNIIRADINIGADGRPKGSGTVVFETAADAKQAIGTCAHTFADVNLPIMQVCTTALTGMAGRSRSGR